MLRSPRRGGLMAAIHGLLRTATLLPIVALVLLMFASCSFAAKTTSTSTGGLTTVKLALDWTPNTNHTGIYVAMEKGWYRQEGIGLHLLPYSSSIAPEQLVGTGQADFGISFAEGVTSARTT